MAEFFETDEEERETNYILENLKEEYPDLAEDDVEYVLDILMEYFEKAGFFDEDEDEDKVVEFCEADAFNYVTSVIEKDGEKGNYSDQLIEDILKTDYEYCVKEGIFPDEDEDE